MWVWEEVRFYFFCVAAFFRRIFWMQVRELVWVGDGFEPEFVGGGVVARKESRGLAVDE